VVIGRQFGLLVWPLMGAAAVMGFLAWRFYQGGGAEHALLRAVAAAILTAIAVFGLIISSLGRLFPQPRLARLSIESGSGGGGRRGCCGGRSAGRAIVRAGVAQPPPAPHPASPIPWAPSNSCAAANAASSLSRRARKGVLPSAPKPSDCATVPAPASMRSISA